MLAQVIKPESGQRGNFHRVRQMGAQGNEIARGFRHVQLVKHRQHHFVVHADFAQHLVHGFDLMKHLRVRGVDHMDEQIRLDDFFKRGLERLDEVMRKFADEPHRVGEQRELVVRQFELARGRVERGEKFVVRQNARLGEGVDEGGFAGVRVTNQRDQRPPVAAASAPLFRTPAPHLLQAAAMALDVFDDAASVELELLLAGSMHADTALLALKMRPHPAQARQQVLELRKLDLQAPLGGARVLGEDVENHLGAVDDLRAKHLLEVASLRGGQLLVKNHGGDVALFHLRGDLVRLAFANQHR